MTDVSESPNPSPSSGPNSKPKFALMRKSFHIGGLISFWGWNCVAVMIVLFIVLPYLLIPFIEIAFSGIIPLSVFVCIIALALLPFIAIWMAATQKMPVGALMFGLEIPLFTLLILRMLLVREMTFASGFLILSALLAIGLFTWGHWTKSKDGEDTRKFSKSYQALSPLMLVTGGFVAVLAGLYAIPFVGSLLKLMLEFLSFKWVGNMHLGDGIFLAILAVFFFMATLMVFILFPLYLAVYYPALWNRVKTAFSGVNTKRNFLIYSGLFSLVWVGIHGLSSQQPNANYVAELEAMPPAERVELLTRPKQVKSRLLHSYLNEYRYLGYEGTSNNLDVYYNRVFGSKFAHVPQSIQNYLLAPLLYKGARNDKQKAGEIYQDIFDASIQKDHKVAIAKALKTTYNRDDIEAGLMNIGARNVALTAQNIMVEDKGHHAVISIEEVYKNLTNENQEIFYYFSLPSDAALSGVWIGQTPNRDEMDAYIVAPRGAAQEVYERSVRRQIDPALLEQVGPRQYRLRVFPIPVETRLTRAARKTFEPMRLHMEIVTPRSQVGFILPKLLEKRNIDWNRHTQRTLNGQVIKTGKEWMPANVKAQSTTPLSSLKINSVAGYSVTGEPQTEPFPREGLSLAVLVDTSYSMREARERLTQTTHKLTAWAEVNRHSVDYVLSYADGTSAQRVRSFDPEALTLFGQITAAQQLEDFKRLSGDVTYDGIIILTDQGTYGTDAPAEPYGIDAPLWFIHLGLPAFAYDDHILDLIYKSGGGVAEGFEDFERRIGFTNDNAIIGASHVWRIAKNDSTDTVNGSLSSLAAKQIIAQAARGTSPTPEALDKLHDIAKTHSVVTPYSSMIVLVNERQKQALKEASEKEDRFERESKPGEETLQSPNQPLVSAVPEPHEWLLIFLSVMMLMYAYRNRDQWV